jgi:hypothetical protein
MVKSGMILFGSVLAIVVLNVIAYGEVMSDLDFIMVHNSPGSVTAKESSSFNFESSNELKIAMMGLIRVYQWCISSQDMKVCNFTPSCSRFGMAAIKKYGVFQGILMTSDRLQRCNGVGRKYYHIHPITGLCDDPVEHYSLWNK